VEDPRETFYRDRVRTCGLQYSGFDVASTEISINFSHSYDVLQQVASRYMGDFGLSRSSLNVLMLLRHGPSEGLQLHDLGELLLVSRANITGLIDHLEEKGYVTRVVDQQDRRARFARITAKAEALLDEFMPLHYQNLKLLLQDLSEEEKETLTRLLVKARYSISAHAEECLRLEPVTCPALG